MGQILKSNGSKAKVFHTTPSYRAQADSATSFYIFRGHVRSSDIGVYFCPVKRRKKFMKIAILELLPGMAQPLVRKLDNLLAAVECPGKIFKHGIIPAVLLQGHRVTKLEIPEPGFHSSLMFTWKQLLRRILLILLRSRLLTSCHHNTSGCTGRAC